MPEIATHPSAEMLADNLKTAIAKNGQASLIVCGGSSPLAIFSALQDADLDWSKVMISLVDDRLVDDQDDASNVKLIKDHLIQGPIAAAEFKSLKTSSLDDYAAFMPFDVMLLGMGPDGHFASLFPDMIGQDDAFDPDAIPQIIATPPYGNPKVERISMNMAMILNAHHLYMIIAGDAKKQVWQDAQDNDQLPIHYLRHQTTTKLHTLEG